ncbi:uncharacterized protein LOC127508564 [Ctenopharyngodon idella]|uniref:uncharacterized protein LOC127508564 n=1 Tax=Ctenopharyngodon idella TaxID=7959 RepID=UPI00222E81C1|nr:uncharacterized protein LOC127508564 [Ctenopharyngodon idella]
MANTVNMIKRINSRGSEEILLQQQHISIDDLKQTDEIKQEDIYKKYISKKYIPDYPTPVEFHITEVAHATNKTGLPQILNSEGFKGLDEDSFSWWSLKINEADIRAAEERFLESLFPERTEEESAAQQPFLSKFTTSPAFNNENSHYSNFCFTFLLTELMEAYKKQMCEGEEPVLRVYGTKLFNKLIEYVVLVHSPQNNEKFSQYPLLTSSPLISYDGNQIIWRAQAICRNHKYQQVINGNQAFFQKLEIKDSEYYVWDQVSLAFQVKEVLTFPKERLKPSACEIFTKPKLNRSNEEKLSREEAEEYLKTFQW